MKIWFFILMSPLIFSGVYELIDLVGDNKPATCAIWGLIALSAFWAFYFL